MPIKTNQVRMELSPNYRKLVLGSGMVVLLVSLSRISRKPPISLGRFSIDMENVLPLRNCRNASIFLEASRATQET